MRSYFPVLSALGMMLMIFGLLMGLPMAVSAWRHDGAIGAYDNAIAATALSGFALWAVTRGVKRRDLRIRDGFLLVALTWLVLPIYGGLPLMFYLPGLSFTDAYFEAASGLTTTGATVLTGLDGLPLSLNLWRTLMHWVGGMGVIVLAVAILPLLGIGGRQLYKAETPGPMKESSLTPADRRDRQGLVARLRAGRRRELRHPLPGPLPAQPAPLSPGPRGPDLLRHRGPCTPPRSARSASGASRSPRASSTRCWPSASCTWSASCL